MCVLATFWPKLGRLNVDGGEAKKLHDLIISVFYASSKGCYSNVTPCIYAYCIIQVLRRIMQVGRLKV